jgi:hypothetical protein
MHFLQRHAIFFAQRHPISNVHLVQSSASKEQIDFPNNVVCPYDSAEWTSLQGHYLAFIYAYMTIHNQAPAERDMQQFFQVTPRSVHNMLKLLEHHGLIRQQPGVARSIQLLVPPKKLPTLRRYK